MDLCLSRRKENRRIDFRAEGSAFVFGVFDAWHNRVVSVFVPPSAEPDKRRWSRSARVLRTLGGNGVTRGFRLRLQLSR